MATHAGHHTAIRVSDIERAACFYVSALGGQQRTLPFLLEGELADAMYRHRGVRVLICHVGFESGGLELFQFLEPATRPAAADLSQTGLLHWAVRVDDVRAAAAAVEREGGRLVCPVVDWAGHEFAYCEDPDGNVIELAPVGFDGLAPLVFAYFPDADPDRRGS